jgi:hypothetical protein
MPARKASKKSPSRKPSKKAKKLSPKHEKFAAEYLKTNNATKAAKAAGYEGSGIRVQAHRLLTNANILERIDRAKKRSGITPEEVLGTLGQYLHSDITDLLDETGRFSLPIARENGVTGQIRKMRIKERELFSEAGPIGVETTYDLELYSALDAAKTLADIFGLKQMPRENEEDRRRKTRIYEQLVSKVIARAKAEANTELSREQAIEQIAVFDGQIRTYLVC